jgi:predicted PurR-regulated permease PerM
MAADSASRTLVLLACLAVLAWAVWLVRDVLPPFLIALAAALLLDPLLDRMERRGLPRWAAVAITFAGFLAAFFGVLAFLVPKAIAQIAELVRNMDGYAAQMEQAVSRWTEANAGLLARLRLPSTLPELWSEYQEDIMRYVQVLLQRVFTGMEGAAGMLSWVVIIPIITLYLMIDLDAIRARLFHLAPCTARSSTRPSAPASTCRTASSWGCWPACCTRSRTWGRSACSSCAPPWPGWPGARPSRSSR